MRPARPTTLTIDGPTVRAMAKRADVRAAFPFLSRYARAADPGCCGSTGGGPDPGPALAAIAKLSAARIKVLKELLGVGALRVWVVRAGRAVAVDR